MFGLVIYYFLILGIVGTNFYSEWTYNSDLYKKKYLTVLTLPKS